MPFGLSAQTAREARTRYITFLPADSIDSIWEYAATDLVPVIYKVNLHHLTPTPQLDTLSRLIDEVKIDPRFRFHYVYVGGSASPEGPVWWNKALGHYRSSELERYLKATTQLRPKEMRVENLMEDWGSTVRTLRSASFAPPEWFPRERILDIIAREPDWARRKQRIRDLDRGRSWTWMVRTIFPPYRNSRLVIVCERFEPFNAAVPLPAAPDTVPAAQPAPLAPRYDVLPLRPASPWPSRFLAVKNNVAFDAALVFNIGYEMELWPHTSLDIPFYYSPYDITETWRIRLFGLQPELRYWPKQAGSGWFAGLHATIMGFDVSLNTDGRYQDPNRAMWGIGLGGGWATHLGHKERWGLEVNAGLGFLAYDYRSYRNWHNGPQYGAIRSHTWWGPTRLGLTLSYQWHKPRHTRRGIR